MMFWCWVMKTEPGEALGWAGFHTKEIKNIHYFQNKVTQIILLVAHSEYHLPLKRDLILLWCLMTPTHP